MGKVVSSAMMSLDGYIARTDNTIGRLFDSLGNGDVEIATATPDITFRMTPQTAAWWREWMASIGAIVVGRTLFDFTDGWGGRHTMDDAAQEIAGDRVVAVAAGTIARQCLELGLLDEVAVDLVPVVMGRGKPYFGELAIGDVVLGDPTTCIRGDRVTHLVFPVLR